MIETKVRRGELVPVALEGAGKQEHWADPAVLEGAAGTLEKFAAVRSEMSFVALYDGQALFADLLNAVLDPRLRAG